MGQNRGLGGVWGNDDGETHQERLWNGVLCWNWGVVVTIAGKGLVLLGWACSGQEIGQGRHTVSFLRPLWQQMVTLAEA